MSKMKEHEQSLIDLGRLIAALHPTDIDLRGALNRCIVSFGQVEAKLKEDEENAAHIRSQILQVQPAVGLRR